MGEFYGCPLFIEGEAFDCRLFLGGRTLQLGETYELPVKFLSPDLGLPKLSLGKSATLWEGKDIATGKVVRLAWAVAESYEYDPYGAFVRIDGSGNRLAGGASLVGNPYRFMGRAWDGETGLTPALTPTAERSGHWTRIAQCRCLARRSFVE